jgi:hypothetical protein
VRAKNHVPAAHLTTFLAGSGTWRTGGLREWLAPVTFRALRCNVKFHLVKPNRVNIPRAGVSSFSNACEAVFLRIFLIDAVGKVDASVLHSTLSIGYGGYLPASLAGSSEMLPGKCRFA